MTLTRRHLLKLAAASSLGVTVVGPRRVAAGAAPGTAAMAVLVDVAQCIGCRLCEGACKAYHGLPAGEVTDLSPTAFTYVRFRKISKPLDHVNLGHAGANRRSYKVQCWNCVEPACASACPVAALRKTPAGPVIYDPYRCIGCRYCQLACPFQIPRFEWNRSLPVITKCNMCAERLAKNREPVCVSVCPVHALQFGPRERILAEAAARIADTPGRYVPAIYGVDEVGGTSWVYVSDVPFDELGFPVVVREALPAYTWRALGKIPGAVVALGATLTAVEAIVRRRVELNGKAGGH
jgi:formate dehydrogenase iron-sulfur subunit